ncbi:MAG TPA: HsdR family type I site-specific deoxyribonuclease [Caldilineae bacterium]|nr:HsdR family type I site-specific deoxyribonuclease [Caldilineae bacterium]
MYRFPFTERRTVQEPMARYSTDVEWKELTAEEAARLRRGEDGLLLHEIFVEKVQQLNPGIVGLQEAEELADRLRRVRPNIEGNQVVWEHLRGLRTVYVPSENRERNVRLVDTEHWSHNAFHVVQELRYTGGRKPIRIDIAYFVNGVPVLLVETKAAHKREALAEALDQVRRYHEEGAPMLALMQLFAITHLVRFFYGPTWNLERKALINWREDIAYAVGADFKPAPTGARPDFETLVKQFVHPARVVRVLRDFILFVRRDGELSKVVLRPHQMSAVEKVIQRAEEAVQPPPDRPPKRRGLIWHTQGSGKTYTMITIARMLLNEPIFQNPTVIMLVDRNELEQQLFSNLAALGMGHAELAQSKRHLRELLRSDYRGLIVSTIHKFDRMPPNINTRANIFVLIDEAHRTTGGDLGTYLMAALPNATIVGFTGTPIDRSARGRGTFQIFGVDDPPHGYLDKYSIRQSIEDGATVPLHYALADNELRVDRETLEREFLDLTEAEGIADPEQLNRILERAVTLRNMLKNRDRIDRVARFVAEHYREYVEPLGYKAFLVAVDREACALYKEALDRYLPPEASEVVISAGRNDSPLLRRYHHSEEEEREIRERFRKEENPKFLIVTEKLLTGFDAPVLYAMYLDKPMRDHVLLQAIARVNRPYEQDGQRKTCGLIVDFVGIFDNLEKALAFDSQDIAGVVTELGVLERRFADLMEQARQGTWVQNGAGHAPPLQDLAGGGDDKAVERVLDYFRDEDVRQAFYEFFEELSDLYEVLSPSPFLRPYLDDYTTLARMVALLKEAYDPGVPIERDILRKTAELVQKHTHGGEIRGAVEVYEINADLLRRLQYTRKPPTVEIFSLMKSIRQKVAEEGEAKPFLLSIGERAEAVVRAFEQRQQEAQEALEALKEIIAEINAAEQEFAQKGMEAEAFTVYWLLRQEHITAAEPIARDLVNTFREYPHWATSGRQGRELRLSLYKVLRAHGVVDDLPDRVRQIMEVLRRRHE